MKRYSVLNTMIISSAAPAGTVPAYSMKKISGATVSAETASGVFSKAKTQNVKVEGYSIGETAVKYELWYAVRQLAEASMDYKFFNKGREGSKGKDGAEPTANKDHPVTYISWRDAMIWCNAYSEATGKTPVYYEDAGFAKVLKTSQGQDAAAGEGIADKAFVKADADGFRLPTETEWEFAARGGNALLNNAAWMNKYAGTNDEKQLADIAWYMPNSGQATHPVGEKQANGAGLKDINGNVWEWCFNVYENNRRAYRGGSWKTNASDSTVSYRNSSTPYMRSDDLGIRIVSR